MDSRHPLTRRRLLRYGSLTLVALVACSDDDEPAVESSPDPLPTDPPAGTVTPGTTGAPGTAATEPPVTSLAADPAATTTTTAIDPALVECTVTPAFQAGPFYIDTGDVRRDVTEGIIGAPTAVRFTLVDAATCEPLAGLPVDIWSASPSGAYSGVDNSAVVDGEPDTTGETFLRGRQIADDGGVVEFDTLYPGWYPVTAPHFHFTAPFDEDRSFTWQFFLDDAFSDEVYSTVEPYAARGPHPVRVDGDGRSIDPSIVLVPSGPAAQPSIERVVAIDLAALAGRPDEWEG